MPLSGLAVSRRTSRSRLVADPETRNHFVRVRCQEQLVVPLAVAALDLTKSDCLVPHGPEVGEGLVETAMWQADGFYVLGPTAVDGIRSATSEVPSKTSNSAPASRAATQARLTESVPRKASMSAVLSMPASFHRHPLMPLSGWRQGRPPRPPDHPGMYLAPSSKQKAVAHASLPGWHSPSTSERSPMGSLSVTSYGTPGVPSQVPLSIAGRILNVMRTCVSVYSIAGVSGCPCSPLLHPVRVTMTEKVVVEAVSWSSGSTSQVATLEPSPQPARRSSRASREV